MPTSHNNGRLGGWLGRQFDQVFNLFPNGLARHGLGQRDRHTPHRIEAIRKR